MSRVFTIDISEYLDGAEREEDGPGIVVSPDCVADILRCIADDVATHSWDDGKLVHPDD